MNILILPSTYDCQNVGDVAMLQVAVSELRRVFPASGLSVLTADADALSRACPGVAAVIQDPRRPGSRIIRLLRRVHPGLSTGASWLRERAQAVVERQLPDLGHWVRSRRLERMNLNSHRVLREAIGATDLFVCSGAGGMTDCFPMSTAMVLDALELAVRLGKPAVMLSQGMGPLRRRDLRARAGVYLPQVTLIGVREKVHTVPFLRSIGVRGDRVVDTGDDAVALAYAQRSTTGGEALGVNLRVASYAGVGADMIPRFCSVLSQAVRRHKTMIVPIPITRRSDQSDWNSIAPLIEGLSEVSRRVSSAATPAAIIQQAGRCRIVVTGAYHGAVFALAQGVPAICLASSQYYQNKFAGLADEFGAGCVVIRLDKNGIEASLPAAIDHLWSVAAAFREPLLSAAARQAASIRAAYDRLADQLSSFRAAESLRAAGGVF